jgi:formimidoylglutamate deiminase
MMRLHAPAARLATGWASDVRLEIAADGSFSAVTPDVPAGDAIALPGPVICGMPNLHSHAFQRAMAGLAEFLGPTDDDFWSWRETMYRFLAQLSPLDAEAIAAQVYIEMIRVGYTRVCEFHYLHNDRNGAPYADPATMAMAHLRAARKAGIAITLVPVLYTSGGCGGRPLTPGQVRFAISPLQLIRLVATLDQAVKNEPDWAVAVGVHSVRAARSEEIATVAQEFRGRAFHIHVSEQRREVEECIAWCGRTPVAQLAETAGLDRHWNLVHGTHIGTEEIRMIVNAGACITLCPSTEGNLGDGLFPAGQYQTLGGMFGIGTDSQMTIDPREELRWFEYGRRLNRERRVLSADTDIPNTGAWLWQRAAQSGEAVCAAPVGRIAPGARADFLVLNSDAPALYGREGDALLDSFVLAASAGETIREVWCGGRKVVSEGHHPAEDEVAHAYRTALSRLLRR